MKKIISILLVVSMLFSLSVTVFAAGTEENVLRFRKNGTFKILVLADVQDVYPIDDAMISFVNGLLITQNLTLLFLMVIILLQKMFVLMNNYYILLYQEMFLLHLCLVITMLKERISQQSNN